MKKRNCICALMAVLLYFSSCKTEQSQVRKYIPADNALYDKIVEMDKTFFDAYNTCDLKKQESIYADNIEFLHDKSGLITSKSEIMEGTKKNICGKVTRHVLPKSIEVYPINNYGAVEMGFHTFYNNQEPNAKAIPSKFIIVWKNENDNWKITKVVSLH